MPDRTSVVAAMRNCSDPRQRCTAAEAVRRTTSVIATGSLRAGLVADPPHGHDERRMLGFLLDLGAQPLDVDVDQPGVRGVPVTPDLLEQMLAGEHLTGLSGQGGEQVELERCQLDRLAIA